MSGTIAKPVLRGFVKSYIRKHLAIGFTLSIAAALAYRQLVAEPRKKRYADFYATYDPEKDFQRMCDEGVVTIFKKIEERRADLEAAAQE